MNLANADTLAPIMKMRRSERHERGELFVLIRKSKKPRKLTQDNAGLDKAPAGRQNAAAFWRAAKCSIGFRASLRLGGNMVFQQGSLDGRATSRYRACSWKRKYPVKSLTTVLVCFLFATLMAHGQGVGTSGQIT